MITARPYQTEAVQALYHYFSHHSGNPILALPTGTGKSVVIAMFLRSVFEQYQGQQILIITHVKELIEQNYKKLMALWPEAPAGIYSAGLNKRQSNYPITFAGIASVARKAGLFFGTNLIIIDEAHLVSPHDETMYRKFIQELLLANEHLKVIGLTATPWRLGHGKLTDPYKLSNGQEKPSVFTDFAYDITGAEAFNKLIYDGYICSLVPKRTNLELNLDGVSMRGGEYVEGQLQLAVDKIEVTRAAIRETMTIAADRKHWLVFASGIEHADHIAEALNSFGVPAVSIHSKMTNEQRDSAIAGFKSGYYRAAVNNNVLTTGFDFPEIDLIVMLRPTASTVLWVQMLGRGTRPARGKQDCLVLDFAGNTRKLGPINDPVIPRRKGAGGGTAPVKECPACATWNHASARRCIHCLFEFPIAVKIQETASTQELIRGEVPVVEICAVNHISTIWHQKHGKTPTVKVRYVCGLSTFTEYVCFEHTNYAGVRARHWWKQRALGKEYPFNCDDAILRFEELQRPTHIKVWLNKEYPEILAYCFDGTAFGTLPVPQHIAAPTYTPPAPVQRPVAIDDDEIPF